MASFRFSDKGKFEWKQRFQSMKQESFEKLKVYNNKVKEWFVGQQQFCLTFQRIFYAYFKISFDKKNNQG